MATDTLVKSAPTVIGNRVKSARALSGHTRSSFAAASKISMATMRAWEEPPQGRSGLTNKGAARFIKALNENGIYCTETWVLYGLGPGPKIISTSPADFFAEDAITWGEEESLLRDIASFKENNPNPVVAIITDGGMLPFYAYGDYVAGSKREGADIKQLLGLDCIVKTPTRVMVRRISSVENFKYVLTPINQDSALSTPILPNIHIEYAAEIVWHRRRRKNSDITV